MRYPDKARGTNALFVCVLIFIVHTRFPSFTINIDLHPALGSGENSLLVSSYRKAVLPLSQFSSIFTVHEVAREKDLCHYTNPLIFIFSLCLES